MPHFVKFFPVRMFSNGAINEKKGKTTAKTAIMHKIYKISYQNSYYKEQENVLLKQSITKLVYFLYERKFDLYLMKIGKKLTKIIGKN